MMDLRQEQAVIAKGDAVALEELAAWLDNYHFEVFACGRSGEIELAKCKKLAPDVIRRIVNYI